MISLIKSLDTRLDNLNTHGWAYTSNTNGIRCWRYTAQGRETLTINSNDDTAEVLTISPPNTTDSTETHRNIFHAIDAAEQYMEEHPSSTDPDPARPDAF